MLSRSTLQWSSRLASTEHVLTADGQDLASSSSYRSLLALLLLLCFQLITTDKGHTGLCRHRRTQRVVLSRVGLGPRAQVKGRPHSRIWISTASATRSCLNVPLLCSDGCRAELKKTQTRRRHTVRPQCRCVKDEI